MSVVDYIEIGMYLNSGNGQGKVVTVMVWVNVS